MIPGKGTARLRGDIGAVVTENIMLNALEQGFVAGRVFPYFPVAVQAASYPVLPLKALFNSSSGGRASGSGYNRRQEAIESGMFATSEKGVEYPVDTRHAAIYKDIFDMELAAAKLAQNDVLRGFEKIVAGIAMKSGNYLNKAATASWKNYANADPKLDVDNAKEELRKMGVIANAMLINWVSFQNLLKCAKVQEAVKSIFPDTAKTGTITKLHLEAYLDIELIIAGAMINGENKAKEPVLQDIWSSNVALLGRFASEGEDISIPCVGRTFLWNEGANEEIIVEDYYEEATRSQIIRVRHDIAPLPLQSLDDSQNVLSPISKNCGCHITGVNA